MAVYDKLHLIDIRQNGLLFRLVLYCMRQVELLLTPTETAFDPV